MSLYRWSDIPSEEINQLLSRKMIIGKNEMLALFFLKKDCIIPVHRHHNEQFSFVLKGILLFRNGDGRSTRVCADEVIHIPPNIEHGVKALEDSVSLDIFSPIREDWLKGDESYLRKK